MASSENDRQTIPRRSTIPVSVASHKSVGNVNSANNPPSSSHLEHGRIQRQSSAAAVELAVKSFQTLISFIVGVSIFGASLFVTIVSGMEDPKQLYSSARFKMQTVRIFLAIAWLLFIAALGVAGFSSSILVSKKEKHAILTEDWHRRWNKFGLGVSLLLQSLVIGAFLFLSLALVAYVEVIGWIAVVTSAMAQGLAIFLWSKQWKKTSVHSQ